MKIAIATDHAGREMKLKVIEFLIQNQIEVIDLSKVNTPTDDYPDFAFQVGNSVVNKEAKYGIVICNTGIGVSIAANKVKGVRCAHVSNTYEAQMTRLDNDANVIAISSRLDFELIKEIIKTFINTEFSNEERHIRRIEKIMKYEQG